jgi:hypothetical protein
MYLIKDCKYKSSYNINEERALFVTSKTPIKNVFITGVEGETLKVNLDTITRIVSERTEKSLDKIVKEISVKINSLMEDESVNITCDFKESVFVSPSHNYENIKEVYTFEKSLSNFENIYFEILSNLRQKSSPFAAPLEFVDSLINFEKSLKIDPKFLDGINIISDSVLGRAGKKVFDKFIKNSKSTNLGLWDFLSGIKHQRGGKGLASQTISKYLNKTNKIYLLAHFNAADLTMIND